MWPWTGPVEFMDIRHVNTSNNETFKDRDKINFDMFISVAISYPPPTSILTLQLLQDQNWVVDLSYSTTFNTDWSYFFVSFVFTTIYVKNFHFVSFCFTYWCILLCKYYLKLLNLFNLIIRFCLINHKRVHWNQNQIWNESSILMKLNKKINDSKIIIVE